MATQSFTGSRKPPNDAPTATPASATPVPRVVQLPADADRSFALGYEVASSAFRPLADVRGPLDGARRAELLGTLAALLHRYTEQASIALDWVIDGPGEDAAPLELAVSRDAPVSSIIDAAASALASALARPHPRSGEASNLAVTFRPATGKADCSAHAATVRGRPYEVRFVLAERIERVELAIEYNARLMRPTTIERLRDSYAVLLDAALRDRTTPVERLPLLTPAQIRALQVDDGAAAPPFVPVVRAIEANAAERPTATAASFQGRSISYSELDQRSNQLASHLVGCGVGPEIPVGVCLRPSLELPIAMLAIWKSRGTYLPLDPTHPEAHIGRMLDEARPRIVLTTSDLARLTARFPQFCVDTDSALLDEQPSAAPPPIEPSPADAAYLFYTSGTTGKPKGAVATQGNLAYFVRSAAQRYGFGPDDVFASIARHTFSISLFELVTPLWCGAALHILDRDAVLTPERLCRALERVTVLHAGPSLLGSIFRYLRSPESPKSAFPRMRHASSGGDMVAPSVMEEMKHVFPNAELFVIYGCTEISCMGTTFPIPRDTKIGRTFVGKAFAEITARVLDSNGRLVPVGVVGEICFAGSGVVRGYLDRPELTAEKFVSIDGRRFYRTGDMGRAHPDGHLEILGRRDFQVQLRGIRIELAAIERTAQDLGLAAQCAVVAKVVGEGDMRLIAFVTKPKDDRVASFRRALAAELPDYMIPHHVVALGEMPLTMNGKLDRKRLEELPWDIRLEADGRSPPANERERKIVEVYERVLGVSGVGAEDGFFELGGDSLRGVVALAEIERAIGVAIPPHVLFEAGTARALANQAEAANSSGEPRPILLNRKASGQALFMLSGVHLYRELAERLGDCCSAYGVFTRREAGALDPASAFISVEDMAREYLEVIRTEQPKGPYRLLGYSFAGLVAYEAAQQLRATGEEVRFLALLDAVLPEWLLGWRFRLSQLSRVGSLPLRDVASFALRRIGRRAPAIEFARYRDDAKLGPLEEQRDHVNREAAAKYLPRIRPYHGSVTVIVSAVRLRLDPLKDPTCGWGPHIASMDIHRIDADHFRMMSDAPHVGRVADILARSMRDAEPR